KMKDDKRLIKSLQEQIESFNNKVTEFIKTFPINTIDDSISTQMKEIIRVVEKQEDLIKLLKQYKLFMERGKEDQKELLQQLKTYETEIELLFNFANVESEEEFFKTAHLLDQKRAMESKKNKCY